MSILRSVLRSTTKLPLHSVLRSNASQAAEVHVFVIAGQSNAKGRAAWDGGNDYPSGTMQFDLANQLVQAVHPLNHFDSPTNDEFGFAVQFAVEYVEAHPDVNLVFLPCADGGTGFFGGNWNKGDPIYEATVSKINAFAAANPNATFKGVLWHQGESDAAAAMSETAYAEAFDAMRSNIRIDAPSVASVPWIIGALPVFSASQYGATNHAAIQAAILDTPSRDALVHWVSSRKLDRNSIDNKDNVHWDERAAREMGSRYRWVYDGISRANGGIYTPDSIIFDPEILDPYQWIFLYGAAGQMWSAGNGVLHLEQAAGQGTGYVVGTRHHFWGEAGKTYNLSMTVENYVGGTGNRVYLMIGDEDGSAFMQYGYGSKVYAGSYVGKDQPVEVMVNIKSNDQTFVSFDVTGFSVIEEA